MAATVIPVLIEFLSDTNELAASDVLVFVREAIQKFEGLRPLIIEVCFLLNYVFLMPKYLFARMKFQLNFVLSNIMYDTNLQRLLDAFPAIKSVKVHRAALWILGEYATSPDDIQAVMNQVRQTLGEVVINNIFDK